MSSGQLAYVLAYLVAFLVFRGLFGARNALLVVYILSLGGFAITFFGGQPPFGVVHFGIAGGSPALTSTIVLGVVAAFAFRTPAAKHVYFYAIVFAALLVLGTLFLWGNDARQWAGVALLAFALINVGLGRAVSEVAATDVRLQRAIITGLVLMISVHTAAAVGQASGIDIYVGDEAQVKQASDFVHIAQRMVGLYNHPSVLGKTVLISLAFLLPLSTIARGGYRVLAYTGIGVGLLGTALTLSRANSIGVVAALVVWILLARGGLRFSARLIIGALVGIVTYFYIDQLIERQLERPTDERPELLATGLQQLEQNPWLGIGPNFYSASIGQYDSWAASGFPVHVTWIHMAVEVGLPLAILFFAPLLGALFASLRGIRATGYHNARAVAFIALIPGTLMLAGTGWGLLANATLPFWYLSVGFLWPPAKRPRDAPAGDNVAVTSGLSSHHERAAR